jgi:hypothetical protein
LVTSKAAAKLELLLIAFLNFTSFRSKQNKTFFYQRKEL